MQLNLWQFIFFKDKNKFEPRQQNKNDAFYGSLKLHLVVVEVPPTARFLSYYAMYSIHTSPI